MSFRLLSITGADDQVAPLALLTAASATAVPVEWGLLYYPEREGTPRNPTARRREAFLSITGRVAAHLCGEQVFRELLDPRLAAGRLADLQRYDRVQVNINARSPIFTWEEVLSIYRTLWAGGCHLILQWHEDSAAVAQEFLQWTQQHKTVPHRQVDVLFDASKGKGVCPTTWPRPQPGVLTGYAGGLSPATLPEALPAIAEVAGSASYWLDMESGVRTDNNFDLGKVQQVISQVEAFYDL